MDGVFLFKGGQYVSGTIIAFDPFDCNVVLNTSNASRNTFNASWKASNAPNASWNASKASWNELDPKTCESVGKFFTLKERETKNL